MALDFAKIYKNEMPKLYTYNQFPIKIATSSRGVSKTFPTQNELLRNYFKKGEFFIYNRESQTELDLSLSNGFWDIALISKPEYREHKYEVVANKIIIDNVIVGMGVALTTFGNFRGVPINMGIEAKKKSKKELEIDERLEKEIIEAENFVKNNIEKTTQCYFDEFIPLNPKMSDEKRLTAFKHLLETIFRFREIVKIYLNGNLVESYNVFLEEFNFPDFKELKYGFQKSYTGKSIKGKIQPLAVWLHMKGNEFWQEARDNSIVGKIERGKKTEMFSSGMAYKNVNFKKIKGKPKPRIVLFNLHSKSGQITFWKVKNEELFYVTERTKNQSYPNYIFNSKDKEFNNRLIPQSIQKMVLTVFDLDEIEFENGKSYSTFFEMLPNKKII